MVRFGLSIFLLIVQVQWVLSELGCNDGWYFYTGTKQCYKLVGPADHNGISLECLKQHGELTSIHDPDENQFMLETFSPQALDSSRVYIGLYSLKQNKIFRWEDGSHMEYINWQAGQPDNDLSDGGQYCGAMIISKDTSIAGRWDDVECHQLIYGICSSNSKEIPAAKLSTFSVIIIILIGLILVGIIIALLILLIKRRIKKARNQPVIDKAEAMYARRMTALDPNMSKLRLIKSNELLIDMNHVLGEGEFGVVYAGKYILTDLNNQRLPVAVKVINKHKDISPTIEKDMLEEATIMAQLDHQHLLRLVGISFTENIKIVTPLRPLGSLEKFLKTKKKFLGPRELVLYCYQIASGMEYLAKNKIVHRDLATRNVLMKSYSHVEVTDFGLSAIFLDDVKCMQKLPFRWLAIECFTPHFNNYGEPTDVWAFGVTCWEILTAAKLPYENLEFGDSNILETMHRYLAEGNRLDRPTKCSVELYSTILTCWTESPTSRPKFSELAKTFEKYSKNPYLFVTKKIFMRGGTIETDTSHDHRMLVKQMLGDDDYFHDTLNISKMNKAKMMELKELKNLAPSNFTSVNDSQGYVKLLDKYYPGGKGYYKRRNSDSKIYLQKHYVKEPQYLKAFQKQSTISQPRYVDIMPGTSLDLGLGSEPSPVPANIKRSQFARRSSDTEIYVQASPIPSIDTIENPNVSTFYVKSYVHPLP